MVEQDTRYFLIACALAALAGYVDAMGFIATGGYFLSFMSGNSTRFGVGMLDSSINGLFALNLIGWFVGGVTIGTVAGHRLGKYRMRAMLLAMGACLALGAFLADMGHIASAVSIVATSMGVGNLVLARNGEVRVGVTYMTGTLVKIGQRIGNRMAGRASSSCRPPLFMWLSLIGGGVAGAWVHQMLDLGGLWIAVAMCLLLAMATRPDVAETR